MILSFAEDACADVARAGGKGASLARLTALGLAVPPGFVVPADALARALEQAGALDQLRALLGRARVEEQLGAIAGEAARLVCEAPPDDALIGAVADAYAALGDDVPVAVRSSACAEDSEAASFAGQQETYLHVRGAGAVVERVRDCWASFFSE